MPSITPSNSRQEQEHAEHSQPLPELLHDRRAHHRAGEGRRLLAAELRGQGGHHGVDQRGEADRGERAPEQAAAERIPGLGIVAIEQARHGQVDEAGGDREQRARDHCAQLLQVARLQRRQDEQLERQQGAEQRADPEQRQSQSALALLRTRERAAGARLWRGSRRRRKPGQAARAQADRLIGHQRIRRRQALTLGVEGAVSRAQIGDQKASDGVAAPEHVQLRVAR